MPTGRDDEALSWGDDDPTLDVGSRAEDAVATAPSEPTAPAETVVLPEGYRAVGKGSESATDAGPPDTREDSDDSHEGARETGGPDESPSMGNAELISLGVLGGFAVLYAVGWLIGGLRLQGTRQYLVTDVMYQGALWLAVLAPLIWFTTVLVLTSGRRAWIRFGWLTAGVVLLVPWPFIMVGAVGQ